MKTRKDEPTTTKHARRNLKPRAKPYLRTIGQGVAVGYRRKVKDGLWTVSLYLGNGKYREATIGTADDVLDADGVEVLDFEQARKAVLAKVAEWQAEAKAKTNGGVQTVRTAVEAYIAVANAREDAQSRPRRDAERRLALHVLADPIADVGLHALTEEKLAAWRNRRPERLAEVTRRRITTDLKAALNAAARKYRSTVPAQLPIVIRFGLVAEGHDTPIARDDAALPDSDIRRILAVAAEIDVGDSLLREVPRWDGDLLRLIAVLAATGARFSQAIRLKVGDLQADKGRLMVPVSRKGRGRKGSSHVPVRIGEDVVKLLTPAVGGRGAGEPLLMRWLHKKVQGGWRRVERVAWKEASEMHPAWAQIIAKAGLPAGTVPYALRHSSIVRQLKAGLPVRLVAALHDTSIAMIERHYSASISTMLDDLAASAIVPSSQKTELSGKSSRCGGDIRQRQPAFPSSLALWGGNLKVLSALQRRRSTSAALISAAHTVSTAAVAQIISLGQVCNCIVDKILRFAPMKFIFQPCTCNKYLVYSVSQGHWRTFGCTSWP